MKPQQDLFPLCSLLLCLLFFSNCGKDKDTAPDTQGQMTAVVRGESWSAQMVSAGTVQGEFAISGTAADGSTISLRLDGFAPGVYNSASGSSNAYVWQSSQQALGYTSIASAGIGQVTIDAVNEQDSLISGTFYFLGQEPASLDTISVINGVFTDVKFQVGAAPVGDNFLTVKIDGAPWAAVMVAGFVNGNKLIISATSADASRTVGFFLPADIAAGSYELGSPISSAYGAQYNSDSQTALTADAGTLDISLHDKINRVIEGNFSFQASAFLGSGTASLTEGSFFVKY